MSYEVRINPDEYNYIFENQLYDASIQKNATINFPEGNISSQVAGVGAMEIKAAWRVFPPNISAGIMARYFTMPGLIFIPAQFSATGADLCLNATWGLVGMHIIHKTNTQPQWIWSTFEQIDNVPGENGNAVSPTFNNPNDLQPVCPNIEAPEPQYLWQANQPHAVNQNKFPQPSTQVVRCTPIQASAALNQALAERTQSSESSVAVAILSAREHPVDRKWRGYHATYPGEHGVGDLSSAKALSLA